jgi:hypothetical protein
VVSNPNAYNLYTTNQVQALNIDVPLLKRATNGVFTLTIGLQKATDLLNYAAFPFGSNTVINGAGKIEYQFTVPDNAAFFRLQPQ